MRIHEDLSLGLRSPVDWPPLNVPAKFGTAFRRYPRPNGVLVPQSLRNLVDASEFGAALPPTLPTKERLRLGRVVVAKVTRSIRHLSEALLVTPLPSPLVVLRSCPIEHRSRNVIERLSALSDGVAGWTVDRYLQVRRFGVRCFVDLLAACEEAGLLEASAGPRGFGKKPANEPIEGPPLDEIARRLLDRLPASAVELRTLFPGLFRDPQTPLLKVARAFVDAGIPLPFRVIRRGATEIAVAPASAGVSSSVCENANRQVAAWGLTSVGAVMLRLGVISSSPVNEIIARRLLGALPRLRWLDRRMNWFSFVGERSPLGRAIQRISGGALVVDPDALVTVLAKNHPAVRLAPPGVFQRYLIDIAGCVFRQASAQRSTA